MTVLQQLKPMISARPARLLIYDAIRTASADGAFALQERKAAEDAGELLGVGRARRARAPGAG